MSNKLSASSVRFPKLLNTGGVTENVEISLEALRKANIGFKGASRGLFSLKRCLQGQVDGKHYIEAEKIQVIAGEEFFTRFTI
jgi:hypothetical protein